MRIPPCGILCFAFLLVGLFTGATHACTANYKGNDVLKAKADSAYAYCKAQGYNTNYCILIDFSIHSGKNRFFLWDFKGDSIALKTLCCHGIGGGSTRSTPKFSNVVGSNCSSLGMYRLGARSYSNWGINVHYKMHGLNSTNSNAYQRIVVLHSHKPMPTREIYPQHLPLGWSQGCPVIDDVSMKTLDNLLKTEHNMLLWIYTNQ